MKTKKRKIKVFHGLVNYGTQAGLFAKHLRINGIDAISVAKKDRYNRLIDIELDNNGNIFYKFFKNTYRYFFLLYCFSRYNIFHFYYGKTLFPNQIDLRFYRLFNKKVIFHYLGKDVKLYKESIEKYEITNMVSSSGTREEAIEKDIKKKKRLEYESQFASIQFVCSPVYSEFVPDSILLPLAIDLNDYKYQPKETGEEIVILHAPSDRANKGTSYIIDAIDRLKKQGCKIEFQLCENISHNHLKQKYVDCDIFIDQVLGGYGTAAIEAMAIGRPTISYLRDIHFNENSFPGGVPIIVANSQNIFDVLKNTIENRLEFGKIGLKSRKFVERYHDVSVLTKKLIQYYNEISHK